MSSQGLPWWKPKGVSGRRGELKRRVTSATPHPRPGLLWAPRARTGQCNQAMSCLLEAGGSFSPCFPCVCVAGVGWAWRQEGPRAQGEQRHRPPYLCLRKQQATLRTSAHQCPLVLVLPKRWPEHGGLMPCSLPPVKQVLAVQRGVLTPAHGVLRPSSRPAGPPAHAGSQTLLSQGVLELRRTHSSSKLGGTWRGKDSPSGSFLLDPSVVGGC